jgi:hypothetical protein
MIDKDAIKWFFRGFVLTSLLLAVAVMVAQPTIGQAQGEEEVSSPKQPSPPDVVIADASTVNLTELVMAESELSAQAYVAPLIIPAAAFIDSGSDSYDNYKFWAGNGYVRSNGNGSGLACLAAPAYLPDGATIENLWVYLYDDSADDFTVTLWRKRNSNTDLAENLASVTTSGTSTSVQILGDTTVDPGGATVDNQYYSYHVSACLSSTSTSHRIYAVWIYYTQGGVYLPIVIKSS